LNKAHPIYGIIGDGRVATHLCHYFFLLNLKYYNWNRRNNEYSQLEDFAHKVDIILLLIKDDEIEKFIDDHPFISSKTVIHCSGSLVTDKAIGFHPLMSFGNELHTLEFYQQIAFITDQEDAVFNKIFPLLPNPYYKIDKEEKAFYHALCVMSCNFSVILWSKLFDEMQQCFNIPKSAVICCLKAITNNLTA
jgi:predicted short-subunit dehydrogenase-like oxidoreductase (DUF2520 family)